MSYREQFDEQWRTLTGTLQKEMIRHNETGNVDAAELQILLENEKGRWLLKGQYNNAWLEKMRAAAPAVAADFERELNEIRIEQVEPQGSASSVLPIGTAVGGAAIGFGITKLIGAAAVTATLGTVGLGIVGGAMGVRAVNSKKEDAHEAERKIYLQQLKNAGNRLGAIVDIADGKL